MAGILALLRRGWPALLALLGAAAGLLWRRDARRAGRLEAEADLARTIAAARERMAAVPDDDDDAAARRLRDGRF